MKTIKQYWPAMMASVFSLGTGLTALLMASQVLPVVAVLFPFALNSTLLSVFGSVAIISGLGILAKLRSLAYRERILNDCIEQNTKHNASILNLNDVIVNNIVFDWLPLIGLRGLPKDAANLAKTCTFFRDALRPKLNEIRTPRLVQHVVYGEEAEAKAILEANPSLLKQCATVVDYYGRTIKNATAYQAALGAMDVNMVVMIEPYFDRLENGEQARAKQHLEQYPNGEPVLEPYSFDALVSTISASSNNAVEAQLGRRDDGGGVIGPKIREFRADFEPKVITSGCHFNHQTLLQALDVYGAQKDEWSYQQKKLFYDKVIGYIQRSMPACDVQAFAQDPFWMVDGIYPVDGVYPLKRSFKYGYDCYIFPLFKNKGIGYSYAANIDRHNGELWRYHLLPKKRRIFAERGTQVYREMVLNDKLDIERRIE